MLDVDDYAVTDVAWVRRLVREVGWGTIVTSGANGLTASHYPFLLEDPNADDMVLLTHVGKPDEQILGITGQEAQANGEAAASPAATASSAHAGSQVLVMVEGPNGYISPSWYPPEQIIPTWNFVTAHLWGTPEVLSDDDNYRVLTRLVDEFEAPVDNPSSLRLNEAMTRKVAAATVGLRIPVDRWEAKNKLSQDKAAPVVANVIEQLSGDGPYANHGLADEMRRNYGL